eukprot:1176011-Prorocentrum_minimum.AAC.6
MLVFSSTAHTLVDAIHPRKALAPPTPPLHSLLAPSSPPPRPLLTPSAPLISSGGVAGGDGGPGARGGAGGGRRRDRRAQGGANAHQHAARLRAGVNPCLTPI